nr:hypothetical protein Iba_chr01eCG4750 [Ipomoea batatas]GMC60110.1 hypothetical protein Iba_chr02bCG7700 [Ipomoea batatas]GMC95777.1 hypothetical protein Iba_chr05cCG11820 [Ipomoea batatas]GMC98168.1 hypothetical protein Iba_chr05dCG14010 [Ipomoea batatas]GMD00331.1 hypothetical protein Iba_chr05eCG14220 [Ipomoea batatas]
MSLRRLLLSSLAASSFASSLLTEPQGGREGRCVVVHIWIGCTIRANELIELFCLLDRHAHTGRMIPVKKTATLNEIGETKKT